VSTSERIGLGGDHFDEDVLVDADGLFLFKILRMIKSPYCEVNVLGMRMILKSKK
jgi:hypothetical protein